MTARHVSILVMLSTLLIGCTAHPTPIRDRDYQAGRQLYQQQDYHAAYLRLLASAQRGYAAAQYAVGYQLYRGLGVKQNQTLAVYWLQRAAKQGNVLAQQALQRLDAQKDALLVPASHP